MNLMSNELFIYFGICMVFLCAQYLETSRAANETVANIGERRSLYSFGKFKN